jgi:acetylornithine deacetylase/succinyl-diaminopimelate desuccinylase-like protein
MFDCLYLYISIFNPLLKNQTDFKNSIMIQFRQSFFVALILSIFLLQQSSAQAPKLSANQELARSIFKELIETNTVHSTGNTTTASDAMATRLKLAGYPEKDIQVVGPTLRNRNIVVRLHGTGKRKPMLFLAHLDVVEARREDWSMDPFKLTERDGYFYGRGTMDIKDGATILVADFIRLKQEGYMPDRDLILALTAGEESGAEYNGVEWLLKNQRALIDAEFCINMDAGDPQIKNGKRINRTVQASEKGVLNLTLQVKNPGGHSSLPSKDNAIYRLANGLTKMEVYDFPVQFNEVTKSYFAKMSSFENGQPADDMKAVSQNSPANAVINRLATSAYYNAMMRTTCVATMLEAGHAINALPQSAKATVNCRVMPGSTQAEIQKQIIDVVADSQIVVSVMTGLKNNPASALKPEFMQTVEGVTQKLWPGIPVLPVMEVGATDGIYLRGEGIPTYGISGVFIDVDDNRAHGKDERIGVKEFYDGLEYEYQLIRAFSAGK